MRTAPKIMSIELARRIEASPDFVPPVMLEAAEAVLRAAARTTLEQVNAKRRVGNPERRAQARADLDAVERLGRVVVDRGCVLDPSSIPSGRVPSWATRTVGQQMAERVRVAEVAHARALAVEQMPDLGEGQWTFITSIDGWSGTVEELVGVAGATVPDEPPLDIEPWRAWMRRLRIQHEAEAARTRERDARRLADLSEERRRDALRRVEEMAAETARYASAAERWALLAAAHGIAAGLPDGALARYQQSLANGASPVEALAAAVDDLTVAGCADARTG